MVRRKWLMICTLTGAETPFKPCMMFVRRFSEAKKEDKPSEKQ